jgi:hopanoid biosynthesis associated RND transporter like protein HpnN
MSARSSSLLAAWARAVGARARAVVAVSLVLSGVALAIAVGGLGINTSTTDMIAPDVPFRRHAIAFERAFPAFDEPIVALIEGDAPERVEAVARALAEALRRDRERFAAVEYLPGEPFFARNGLLFLEQNELERLSERLAAAQPMLAALAAEPTLAGLADFIELALVEEPTDGALDPELGRLLLAMARVVDAEIAGTPGVLSWRRALEAETDPEPAREIVLAQPHLDHGSLAPAEGAILAVREHARDTGIVPGSGLTLRLTGEAVLDQEELTAVGSGALTAATITTLAVAALLVIGLGSIRLIAATLITLALGLILTAAVAALAIGRLNLISVTFAVLFVGLGVDFGIHLVLRYREALARGTARADSLPVAVVGIGPGLALSALCAALGFLAFAPTDYRGLAELGVISAAGMAIALIMSLTLLPALLGLMPLERPATAQIKSMGWARTLERHRRAVLGITLLAALGALILLPRVEFDFNPLNLKDPASESVRAFNLLARAADTSPYVIDLLAPDLEAAADLAARLEQLREVGDVVTLRSFVPEAQDEKLEILDSLAYFLSPVLQPAVAPAMTADGRRAALERLETTLAAAFDGRLDPAANPRAARFLEALQRFRSAGPSDAQVASLEARLTATLPPLLERLGSALEATPVEAGDLPDHLRARWLAEDGTARLLVRPAQPIDDNAALARFADAVLRVAPEATGTPVIVREAGRVVIQAFQTASWLALGAISLVLVFVLRRTVDVLLVLTPLALAVLFTAANAVLLGLELNFANVIVLPLLLGLGVSGAIHVVLRERQRLPGEALQATSTPRAVLFSALTTIASFGSLAISAHRGLSSMGQLLTIAILWSLVTTLIVLPSMLAFRHRPDDKGPA